ncbi:hypothetical protein A565_p04 (mitochondrion) [Erythranthe guttata]|uniref:Uncharacterized protein n=1 Tax=Erythranthe guttata TaxID=4155 RepID=I1T1W3_ERYGU|nr:hypothetical protein OOB38_mgp16 [Erythranthe guttata]AEK26542.1 hypothetical protein [Erythranthe guttata]|eukprot:YP_006460173.1 hypothetical protein A565_p04 (mitochondrion) [Erythranthe guttata]
MKQLIFFLVGSSVAGFFGRFLGSEGTAIIRGRNIVLFGIFILGFLFLFRIYARKIK